MSGWKVTTKLKNCSEKRVTIVFEAYGSTLSPPCLDLSMAAAVQSGPPPRLGPSAHTSPSIAALVSRPLPLPVPPALVHHHPQPTMDPAGNGPPNPEVLLALLSRNKSLEGKNYFLRIWRCIKRFVLFIINFTY